MEVIFRTDKNGVFVLFPHDVVNNQGNVTCYQHIGQHSAADYAHCIKTSKKANENEYKDLLKELKNIGYNNLKVVQRQNYNKWLESYRNLT